MTHLSRAIVWLILSGILAAGPAHASSRGRTPHPTEALPSLYTVPCAIVLVGHDFAATQADPYGQFVVVIRDALNNPVVGATITVDFSACCPDVRLSNTQAGPGVSHDPNSAIVTAITDVNGIATIRVEGASSGSPSTPPTANGCATISVTPVGGPTVLITDGINHPTVLVSTPDLTGAAGTPGVDVADLAFWISDKNAYTFSTTNYRQRSDFDYHLPAFNCIPLVTGGNGIQVGDLAQWIMIKNARGSAANGPFPANCP